jgi:hypothetical protein
MHAKFELSHEMNVEYATLMLHEIIEYSSTDEISYHITIPRSLLQY